MKELKKYSVFIIVAWFLLSVVQLKGQCAASFNYSINANGNVTFTSTSVPSNSFTVYQWQFGNSVTYSATGVPTAQVTYTANGTYTVTLAFTTTPTCVNTSTAVVITVTNVTGCNVNASFLSAPGPSGAMNFTSTSTGTVAGTTYSWKFGDLSAFGSGAITSHTYASSGTYNVVLYVNNNFTTTCSDSVVVPVTVNATCNINPGYSYTQGSNGSVNFQSTSTGTIATTNFYWQFGDGGTSTGNPAAHTYTANGTYISTLTVTNNSVSCYTSYTQAVNVTSICGLNTSFTYTLGSNGFVNFASTSTGTVAGTTYTWSYGDSSTGTGVNASHTYTANGLYYVTLLANNNFSFACNDTMMFPINVNSIGCSLVANYTHTVSAGGNVNFANASTGTNTLTTYYWNFGDGFTSMLQSPSHVYSSAGAYNVMLLVTNNASCTDTIIQSVNVTGISCIANSTFSMSPASVAQVWNAYPSSPWNVVAATWNWGDNSSSNTLYTSHTYSAAGNYSVCLSVTVSCGGSSATCINQFIYKTTSQPMQIIQINVIQPPLTMVGLQDILSETLDWSVFPNPNNGQFELSIGGAGNEMAKIKVSNVVGKLVYETEAMNDGLIKNISMNDVSNGIYFIKVSTNNKEYSKKIIINK